MFQEEKRGIDGFRVARGSPLTGTEATDADDPMPPGGSVVAAHLLPFVQCESYLAISCPQDAQQNPLEIAQI